MLLVKNTFDRLFALIFLVLLFPLLCVITLWLWSSLGESPIFTQIRVGKNGKHFRIIKFKTIPISGACQGQGILSFLRSTHIDEIPQLFNILAGSMSLVGPRPHTPEHVALYEPWQRKRLAVKPGITGVRQLKEPDRKMQFFERLEDDILYVENWSIWVDIGILIQTIAVIFRLICRNLS